MSRTVRRPWNRGRKHLGRVKHECTCSSHSNKFIKKNADRKQRRRKFDES